MYTVHVKSCKCIVYCVDSCFGYNNTGHTVHCEPILSFPRFGCNLERVWLTNVDCPVSNTQREFCLKSCLPSQSAPEGSSSVDCTTGLVGLQCGEWVDCTCMYTRTHTHTRARTHTHARAHTHTHVHTHACAHTHTHTRTHAHTHAHTHTRTRAHTHTHTHTSACAHMHTHTQTHTHTHAHTHTYTLVTHNTYKCTSR